jgi:hypothetical protein
MLSCDILTTGQLCVRFNAVALGKELHARSSSPWPGSLWLLGWVAGSSIRIVKLGTALKHLSPLLRTSRSPVRAVCAAPAVDGQVSWTAATHQRDQRVGWGKAACKLRLCIGPHTCSSFGPVLWCLRRQRSLPRAPDFHPCKRAKCSAGTMEDARLRGVEYILFFLLKCAWGTQCQANCCTHP